MAYTILLNIHSVIRWISIVLLLMSLIRTYSAWAGNKAFLPYDNIMKQATVSLIHVQLITGFILYGISPKVNAYFKDYAHNASNKEFRFFSMEHAILMLLAVVVITIGAAKSKKKKSDREKFKTLALWFSAGLAIILITIGYHYLITH